MTTFTLRGSGLRGLSESDLQARSDAFDARQALRMAARALDLDSEATVTPVVDEARLQEVLAVLEANQHRWNQRSYISSCNTTGCLAGWTVALANEVDLAGVLMVGEAPISDQARTLLGFTHLQANQVFLFTQVADPSEVCGSRHPTFDEFCARVEEVTGVRYKPVEHLTEGDYA
jgi:hypothetical protein